MTSQPPAPRNPASDASGDPVAAWIERAESTQVPVFSATVADVASIVDSSRSSAADLATAIGRDAGLTAKLLKLANSPLFCQQGRKAQTINSAVVLLGFHAVRDLAITLSIVDQAQNAPGRKVLIDTLVQAFHGAGQAHAIAQGARFDSADEVFLAGLLARLGELVFWSSETPELETLASHSQPGMVLPPEEQRALVGFSLRDITAVLVEQWQLGDLLRDVALERGEDPRVAGIALASEIAAAGDGARWAAFTTASLREDPEAAAIVKRHAELLGGTVGQSLERIQHAAQDATDIARRFGVTLTPRPMAADRKSAPAPTAPTTNPTRQVEVLSAMTALMQQPVTLDQLMRLAIDGIVEGACLPRVFFALLSPDRKAVLIKHQRGEFGTLPRSMTLADNRFLHDALEQPEPVLLTKPWTLMGSPAWRAPNHSLVLRVMVGRTTIGLLYADAGAQDTPIPAESRAALLMFVQQIGLSLLSGNRAS
jgi:HD-like signal output (HDOD) protein